MSTCTGQIPEYAPASGYTWSGISDWILVFAAELPYSVDPTPRPLKKI